MRRLIACLSLLAVALLAAEQPRLGADFARFVLPDGTVFAAARVARFDGQKFHIEHDGGIARVPYAKMPEEWRLAFRVSIDTTADDARAAMAARAAEANRIRQDAALRASAARPQPTQPGLKPEVIADSEFEIGRTYSLYNYVSAQWILEIPTVDMENVTVIFGSRYSPSRSRVKIRRGARFAADDVDANKTEIGRFNRTRFYYVHSAQTRQGHVRIRAERDPS